MKGIQLQSTSRPYGKWAAYLKDGTQLYKEGIYLGDDKQWNRCIKKAKIEDYYTNEKPVIPLSLSISTFVTGLCMCS